MSAQGRKHSYIGGAKIMATGKPPIHTFKHEIE